jgi:hypothetical protein
MFKSLTSQKLFRYVTLGPKGRKKSLLRLHNSRVSRVVITDYTKVKITILKCHWLA